MNNDITPSDIEIKENQVFIKSSAEEIVAAANADIENSERNKEKMNAIIAADQADIAMQQASIAAEDAKEQNDREVISKVEPEQTVTPEAQ